MAGGMTSRVRASSLGLALTLVVAAGNVLSAEPLPDPTRPPPGWAAGQSGAASSEQANSSGLQTVVLPKHGKPWALINGERVVLGGKVGEARLVKITETEVVLKGADGLQTLKMTPSAEKKPAAGKIKKRKSAREE